MSQSKGKFLYPLCSLWTLALRVRVFKSEWCHPSYSLVRNSTGIILNWLQSSSCWMEAKKGWLSWALWKRSVSLFPHLKYTDRFLHETISLSWSIHLIGEAQIIYALTTPTGCVGTDNQNQIVHLIIIHCLGSTWKLGPQTEWSEDVIAYVATCVKLSGNRKAGPKLPDLTSILVSLIGHTQTICTHCISYTNLYAININSKEQDI